MLIDLTAPKHRNRFKFIAETEFITRCCIMHAMPSFKSNIYSFLISTFPPTTYVKHGVKVLSK